MADLAVIILTHNEEIHLARALTSVMSIARQIFVVDSFSTDRTIQIAQDFGATVLQNRFINYAKQFQWALDNAPITSAWIMRLDADEVVEADLAHEIEKNLAKLAIDVTGINLKRKHIFLGRWIRFGGRYPLILLRVWRRGAAQIEDRWMDEHMVLRSGRTTTFNGGFVDHNLRDITYFTDKHNRYATREAIDVLNERLGLEMDPTRLTSANTSVQATVKRHIKEKIYNRVPFYLGALGYFIYRYVFKCGFLDGKAGLIYHVLQGFWYRFLVGAKIMELESAICGLSDLHEIRREISRRTGHDLRSSSSNQTSELPGL
jgi:glycosyltransferase involved in cell wall biosynthesis